jgi:hypothetical protein
MGELSMKTLIHGRVEEAQAGKNPTIVWFYDWDEAPVFDLERHQGLMKGLANSIQKRLAPSLETR